MRVNRLDGAPFLRRHDFCMEGGDWFGDGFLFVRLEGVFCMLVSMRLVVLRKDEEEKWLGAYFSGVPRTVANLLRRGVNSHAVS